MKPKKQKSRISVLIAGLIILTCTSTSMAMDDHVPFFAGKTAAPNVMIIFDNSDSMQDSAYFRDDGNTYRPWTDWRRGVQITDDCNADGTTGDFCIADSDQGNPGGSIRYDEYKYSTDSETELPLPALSEPPHFPGLSASSSTVTKIESYRWGTCAAGMNCYNRIYDSNVDWSLENAEYNPIRYWKVEIKDQDGNTQIRNISGYNSSGYWVVTGGHIEYDPSKTYTYKLVSEAPGSATYPTTNKRYVFDRNFDWGGMSNDAWYYTYQGLTIEIISGTSAGDKRKLQWSNRSYGYWYVDSDFTEALDHTSKYRIIGDTDDTLLAIGGNHPDSKLYQAKLALSKFLDSENIKVCDERDTEGNCTKEHFLMNFGFATFLQARMPRTTAVYYRKRAAGDITFNYIYSRKQSTESHAYLPEGCVDGVPPTQVTFSMFSATHTDVGVGYEYDRPYRTGQCSEQTIRYRLTEINCAPTDSLDNRVQIKMRSDTSWTNPAPTALDPNGSPQWGFTNYRWFSYPDDGSGDCTNFTPPATQGGGWELVDPGEACDEQCTVTTGTPEYYESRTYDTWGDLRVTDPTKPRYIHIAPSSPMDYIVNPHLGYCTIPGDRWLCTTPDPEDTTGDGVGDWTLLTAEMPNVVINNRGDTGTLKPAVYDNSIFRLPSTTNSDDTTRPYGWSYQRTVKTTTQKKDDGSDLDDHHFYYYYYSGLSRWDQKPDPYFPSDPGNPLSGFSNFNGDDNTIFVDLPVVNEGIETHGDDLDGENRNKIKSVIGLTRVPHPHPSYSYSRVHTMAPFSPNSLTVNTQTQEAGKGTPLAGTLNDAREYFLSYMQQDTFSQGGCRNNYIILLTDGKETSGGDPVAAATALQNLVVNGKNRPVKVYVIGFGLDEASKTLLNNIAAAGGSNQAYFADNVDQLVTILSDQITTDVLSGSFGRARAVLTSANNTATQGLSLYSGYFDYPNWQGHLEAWELDTDTGAIKGSAPNWTGCAGTYPPASTGDADAGCMIAESCTKGVAPDGPAAINRRTIYTTDTTGTRLAFDPTNVATLKPLLNPGDLDIDGNGTGGEDQDAKDIINYIHHPGYDNDKYIGTRDTNWPLGDIYNSGPVVVSPPQQGQCVDDGTGTGTEVWPYLTGYCTFKETYKNRDTMVYVSTNGGMIEAIEAGSVTPLVEGGKEKWAYIPNSILGDLHQIKEGHRFSMDLPITAGDVDTSTGLVGTGWKTMLIAGQRKGGKSYTVLDVTDPDNPQPMWEFTDPNLGETWSQPAFGRIVINGLKTSVVFFGGGYSADASIGNRLFIVRASDGVILKELTVGSNANNVPGGIRTTRYLLNRVGEVVDYRTNLPEAPGGATSIDGVGINYTDRKYLVETAYFGDTEGAIWRLSNLSTFAAPADPGVPYGPPWSDEADANGIKLTRLYQPATDKTAPIYYKPTVHDVKTGSIDASGTMQGCVKRYIIAGTGDEQSPVADKDLAGKPLENYVFEIEDREWDSDDATHVPAWTAAEQTAGRFRVNWRFKLGFQLPHDQYGFLLKNDGTRAKKGTQDILNLHTYILDWSTYQSGGYSIDANGHLFLGADRIVDAGNFLIRHDSGSPRDDNGLYTDVAGTVLVATDGSYYVRDLSLWLIDENDCFYDTDGSCLVDTTTYNYNNDGDLLDGGFVANPFNIISDPGEKALSEISSLAGNIFFTTYSPEGGCAMGHSYFYGIEISSCSTEGGTGVLSYDEEGKKIVPAPVRRIGLGLGITPGVTVGSPRAYIPTYKPGEDPEIKSFQIPPDLLKLKYWRQN